MTFEAGENRESGGSSTTCHYDLPIVRGVRVSLINSERGVSLGQGADGRGTIAFAEPGETREGR